MLSLLSVTHPVKKVRYKGTPSEVMEPIEVEGRTIKVLRHGNTGHVLYYAPRTSDLEYHWTMDLETVRKGVAKLNEEEASKKSQAG